MPLRAPTPCRHPGCGAVLTTPGYCDAHRADHRQWDSNTGKRQRQEKRALPTNSAAWRGLRARVLRDEPLCRECLRLGVLCAASVVDHIDGDSHNNDRSNLQSLCSRCHARVTARHDGGFGNPNRRRQADRDC
ncbi:MAG: HNH endonuclease [Candidatus Accumulibacter meliphilus]|uniref:Putative HNH nuclease YajD n=1 Tax=Candidatus Accumulibacter meliphilus TaxID=2211374 RepID=A0A369XSW4_9PROT|nr:MAG: HNH endonuclease [Candidatus Accumulibacter meliphilus]